MIFLSSNKSFWINRGSLAEVAQDVFTCMSDATAGIASYAPGAFFSALAKTRKLLLQKGKPSASPTTTTRLLVLDLT